MARRRIAWNSLLAGALLSGAPALAWADVVTAGLDADQNGAPSLESPLDQLYEKREPRGWVGATVAGYFHSGSSFSRAYGPITPHVDLHAAFLLTPWLAAGIEVGFGRKIGVVISDEPVDTPPADTSDPATDAPAEEEDVASTVVFVPLMGTLTLRIPTEGRPIHPFVRVGLGVTPWSESYGSQAVSGGELTGSFAGGVQFLLDFPEVDFRYRSRRSSALGIMMQLEGGYHLIRSPGPGNFDLSGFRLAAGVAVVF